MTPKIPVTVLAGAMGAGKTTLINRIVSESGQRILVIQNELGEVTVEGTPVISTDEEIFDMDDGLVCGTVRGDLIRALVSVTRRREQYDRILIEATGPADPGPIVRTFLMDQEIQRSFRLDGLAMLVDGRLLSLYTEGKTGRARADRVRQRADREQDRHGVGRRGRGDGALAAHGQRHRPRPQHQLRQPAARAAAQHRPARDRSRARPRHAARPTSAFPPSSARARPACRPSGGRLPTAKAKGWRVDVGEFPRAIAWGNADAELAVGDGGGRGRGPPRRATVTRSCRRTVHEGAINSIAWQPGTGAPRHRGRRRRRAHPSARRRRAGDLVRPGFRSIDVIAWSPKGDMLAVAKGDAGFIFGADGKQLRRIPAVDSTITGLTWSPDGAAIACSCYGGVHVIDPRHGRTPAPPAGKRIDAEPRLEPGRQRHRVGLPGQQRALLALPARQGHGAARHARSSRGR